MTIAGFDDILLPEKFSFGSAGGSGFATAHAESRAGYAQSNIERDIRLGQWQLNYANMRTADMQELIAFFNARYGDAYTFRFKDHVEYQATNVLLGVGDGANKDFQCKVIYADTVRDFDRPIQKPLVSSIVARIDGTPDTVASVSDLGVITLTSTPAGGEEVRADFDYHNVVRFTLPRQAVRLDSVNTRSWHGVGIKEVLLRA